MREKLEQIVKKAICLECKLPYIEKDIDKSCITDDFDVCFKNKNPQDLAKVIYNGIVEFSINEYKINYDELEKEQLRVIKRDLRYSDKESNETKLKYGFYGEILLDLILRIFMNTKVLIARGYFYSPVEKSEPKGFDAFHLFEKDNELELWFGEAKFYLDYKKALNSVLEKIHGSICDEYISNNLIVIIKFKDQITTKSEKFDNLIKSWEEDPNINLGKEMKKYNIKLIYPIFIAYQQMKSDEFYASVKKCIGHINTKVNETNINIVASFDYNLFFILFPLSEVRNIKESVIKWIDTKEPLI